MTCANNDRTIQKIKNLQERQKIREQKIQERDKYIEENKKIKTIEYS